MKETLLPQTNKEGGEEAEVTAPGGESGRSRLYGGLPLKAPLSTRNGVGGSYAPKGWPSRHPSPESSWDSGVTAQRAKDRSIIKGCSILGSFPNP